MSGHPESNAAAEECESQHTSSSWDRAPAAASGGLDLFAPSPFATPLRSQGNFLTEESMFTAPRLRHSEAYGSIEHTPCE